MLGSAIQFVSGASTAPVSNYIGESVRRAVNEVSPIALPAPGDLIRLLHSRQLTWETYRRQMLWHGCLVSEADPGHQAGYTWDRLADSYRPRPTPTDLVRLALRAGAPDQRAVNELLRQGYSGGAGLTDALLALYRPPVPQDAIALMRHGYIDADAAARMVSEHGMLSPDYARHLVSASAYVPGPSDVIRMMQRDVADRNIVDAEGLHKEFPEKYVGRIKEYAKRQGIPESVALDYWAAHWVYPSPTQAYQMLHRLRPGREAVYHKVVPGTVPVQLADVRRLLGIEDYAPNWRDRLAAISYTPINRTDLRQMVALRLVRGAEAEERFKDLAYTEDDAKLQARLAERTQDAQRARSVLTHSTGRIQEMLDYGTITEQVARQYLGELGLTPDEVDAAFGKMTSWARHRRIKAAVAAGKRLYLDGVWSRRDAQAGLAATGMDPPRIPRILDGWDLLLLSGRKVLSVKMIAQLLNDGALTQAEASARLTNLGYTATEVQWVLNSNSIKRSRQLAAQLKELIRSQERAQERARAALARTASRSQILRWVRRGLLRTGDARDRLIALGATPADADRYLTEATGG